MILNFCAVSRAAGMFSNNKGLEFWGKVKIGNFSFGWTFCAVSKFGLIEFSSQIAANSQFQSLSLANESQANEDLLPSLGPFTAPGLSSYPKTVLRLTG